MFLQTYQKTHADEIIGTSRKGQEQATCNKRLDRLTGTIERKGIRVNIQRGLNCNNYK